MDHRKYVPVLKWKMGEYQALARLSENVRSRVVPLLEVLPSGFDFETKQVKKTPAEQLKDFGKKLYSKWEDRNCFVDLKFLDPDTRIGAQHYLDHVFKQTSAEGCGAIPVATPQSDPAFLKALTKINDIAQIGLAIRLSGADFDDSKLMQKIKQISVQSGVGWGETDVIIDLCSPIFVPKTVFRGGLTTILATIPQLNKARSIIVVATSYPKSLAEYRDKEQFIPRHEWTAYKNFVEFLDDGARIPTFGDYGVSHPDPVEFDMRFVTPFAKLRYTLEEHWYLAVGKAVRSAGFEQYRDMCKKLVKKDFFDGADFSEGDAYIEQCAKGEVPTGNLSTWVWVATNRHITKSVFDLSSFHGLSGKL
jgi:hypothetical protein